MMPCMTDPPTAQGDHALAFFTPPNIRDWRWALRLFLDRIERCPLIAQTLGPGGPNQIPSGLLFSGIAPATVHQSYRWLCDVKGNRSRLGEMMAEQPTANNTP